MVVCTGLLTGSVGNEDEEGRGATLSLGAPTIRSLPSASTRVMVGRSGLPGGKSTSRVNMAKVSLTMRAGAFAGDRGVFTIGSRDLVFDGTLPLDFARNSSGSRCSAPGALEVAFAFSSETVRR